MALTPSEEALVRELIAQNPALLSLADNEATITSRLGATTAELSDLSATASVSGTDLMLIRQGTTDKSVTPAVLMGPQFQSDALDAIAPLTPAADRFPYFTGASAAALATLTASARTLLSQGNYAAMRDLLDLEPGVDVQAYDTDLAAIAALSTTAFGRALLTLANAAAGRTSLGAMAEFTSVNLIQNGGYIVHANGLKETWGYVDVGANSNATYAVPVTHTSWIIPTFAFTVQSGDDNNSENTGITSVSTSSIGIYSAENFTVRVYIQTKGV